MRKLSSLQREALEAVRNNQGLTTNILNQVILGNRSSYDSLLRDRLFNLASKGLVRYEETLGPRGSVIARRWFAV